MKRSIAMETLFKMSRARCGAVALAVLILSWQAFATFGDHDPGLLPAGVSADEIR